MIYKNDNQELQQFKQINLISYLQSKNWTIDKNDSDKKQNGFIALRKDDQKLIVKLRNGSWFYVNKKEQNKGSIIDYLKNFDDLTLGCFCTKEPNAT